MRLQQRSRCSSTGGQPALVRSRHSRSYVCPASTAVRNLFAVLHAGGSGRLRPRWSIESGGLECGKRLSRRLGLPRFLPRCGLRSLGGRVATVSPSAGSLKIYRPEVSPRDRTNGGKETLQSGESPGGGRRTRRRFFRKA